jgi:hypothetical protein
MKYFASLLLLCSTFTVVAQDYASVHFAQTFSRFRFTDSQGNVNENLYSDIRYSYGLSYQKLFKGGIFIRPELGYNNLGALSIHNNQKHDWSLHYLDASIGGGLQLDMERLKPYVGASFYTAYLYKANQTIATNYFNLLEDQVLKRFDYGLKTYVGIQYAFTKDGRVFIELNNLTGLHQLEINSESMDDQKLFNRAFSVRFGLVFTINNIVFRPKFIPTID